MLEKYNNPSEAQFWFKWITLVIVTTSIFLGIYFFILKANNELEKEITARHNISLDQMIQVSKAIYLYNAKHDASEINSLAGYQSVMSEMVNKKVLNSVPKNTLDSNYEFYGDGIEFIGFKIDKKTCKRFLSEYNNVEVKSYDDIGLAYQDIGTDPESGNRRVFCFKDKSIQLGDEFLVALRIYDKNE
jgi:hypothetical protein